MEPPSSSSCRSLRRRCPKRPRPEPGGHAFEQSLASPPDASEGSRPPPWWSRGTVLQSLHQGGGRLLQIPGYQDVLQIHWGRQYAVFRVREERTGTPCIIKRVQPGPYAAHATDSLRHEHEMLCGLDVPGVVRPLRLLEVTGDLALVLEDAGPFDLEQRLGQKPLELGSFLELAIQAADIALHLHQRNVIHRDINPSNLVVRPDTWRLTLIDFGTATRATGLVGASEGTLAYIAPEQTGRMNRLVDHRADLYSLGATFYEMLTGIPPFVSADPVELVHAHLARSPVPPEQLNPSIPRSSPASSSSCSPRCPRSVTRAPRPSPWICARPGVSGRTPAPSLPSRSPGMTGRVSSSSPAGSTGESTSWPGCAALSSGPARAPVRPSSSRAMRAPARPRSSTRCTGGSRARPGSSPASSIRSTATCPMPSWWRRWAGSFAACSRSHPPCASPGASACGTR
ncbi:protein kinase [Archangium gephyra]|nr:protein kinase [Archangium gephyra]